MARDSDNGRRWRDTDGAGNDEDFAVDVVAPGKMPRTGNVPLPTEERFSPKLRLLCGWQPMCQLLSQAGIDDWSELPLQL